MRMHYIGKKGFAKAGRQDKLEQQKFVTREQLAKILAEVEFQAKPDTWRRDHCLIHLGFHLGLRVSEAVILNRETFRDLHAGEVHVRTLKQAPRVRVTCHCGRRFRVAARRGGTEMPCPDCGAFCKVVRPKDVDPDPPERMPPLVESFVREYIGDYMDNHMFPEQSWFFEGRKLPNGVCGHLSSREAHRIFSHYAISCGLSPKYSFHSLRHGRAVQIHEKFGDPVLLRDMLRHTSLASGEQYLHLSPAKKAHALKILEDEEG